MNEDNKNNTDNNKDTIGFIKYFLVIFIISVILSKIITSYIFVIALIPSESMKNTLKIGDKVIVNIIGTHLSDIKRGDIVVFYPPDDVSNKEYFIKRVIGLSGETIEIKQGIVYVNGKELKEDYISSNNNNDYGPYIVPENCYFVLGDNRANSFDARYWNTPYISSEDIVGKAVIKLTGGIYKFDSPVYEIQ